MLKNMEEPVVTVEGSDAHACHQSCPCCLPRLVGLTWGLIAIGMLAAGVYLDRAFLLSPSVVFERSSRVYVEKWIRSSRNLFFDNFFLEPYFRKSVILGGFFGLNEKVRR